MSFLTLIHQQLAITGIRISVDLSIIRIISLEILIVHDLNLSSVSA
jgi:hypothetical protein